MQTAHMIAYGVISTLTPVVVLINSLLATVGSSSSVSVQPLQSMSLVQRLMNSGPENLVTASDFMATPSEVKSQARVVEKGGQLFLEFYNAFSVIDQTPDLMLLLGKTSRPDEDVLRSDRHLMVSKLKSVAGKQQYAIPTAVDPYQYFAAIIWCPEFNAVLGYAPLQFDL